MDEPEKKLLTTRDGECVCVCVCARGSQQGRKCVLGGDVCVCMESSGELKTLKKLRTNPT